MFIKLLILSVILVAFVMLALGVKLLFDPDAEFSSHSCAIDKGSPNGDGGCSKCKIATLTDCAEKL